MDQRAASAYLKERQARMLVLSQTVGNWLDIGGDLHIVTRAVHDTSISLGIDAPPHVDVVRRGIQSSPPRERNGANQSRAEAAARLLSETQCRLDDMGLDPDHADEARSAFAKAQFWLGHIERMAEKRGAHV